MDTRNKVRIWLVAGMVLAFSRAASAGDFKVEWKDGIRLKSDEASCALGGRIYFDAYWMNGNSALEGANGPFAPATTATPATPPFPAVPALGAVGGYPFKDGTNIRTGRLDIGCTVYNHFEFKFQPNFAGNAATFEDAFIRLKKLPGDFDITFGHFKQPWSLEELTTSRFITFMERSSPTLAFAPSRDMGLTISNTNLLNKTATATVGVFRVTGANHRVPFTASPAVPAPPNTPSRIRQVDDKDYDLTARLTWAPLLEDKGAELLHLGFSYRLSAPQQDTAAFSARPEINQGPVLVQTGSMRSIGPGASATNPDLFGQGGLGSVRQVSQYSFEYAAQLESFSLQGEYMITQVSRRGMGNPFLWGTYLQGSYMLNGNRTYSNGTFGRPVLKQIAFKDGGIGAWEFAFRWSHLNLIDGDVPGRSTAALVNTAHADSPAGENQILPPPTASNPYPSVNGDGGKLDNYAFAVNWHLTPNFMLKSNYIYSVVRNTDSLTLYVPKGALHTFQTRFQADW